LLPFSRCISDYITQENAHNPNPPQSSKTACNITFQFPNKHLLEYHQRRYQLPIICFYLEITDSELSPP